MTSCHLDKSFSLWFVTYPAINHNNAHAVHAAVPLPLAQGVSLLIYLKRELCPAVTVHTARNRFLPSQLEAKW